MLYVKSYFCPTGCRIVNWVGQGPRNLYGRDGKFRPTFKSGTEKCLFSVPLLITWYPQNAQICTYIFKNFPWVTSPDPQTGEGLNPLRRLHIDERPPSHFFRASAAAGVRQDNRPMRTQRRHNSTRQDKFSTCSVSNYCRPNPSAVVVS